jgi:hypothetical protein
MALPNGVTQRREMEFSASIDLGSRRNQHLYGFDISPYCGDVKRPIVVVSDLVHTDGPVFEHERVRNGEQQLLETGPLAWRCSFVCDPTIPVFPDSDQPSGGLGREDCSACAREFVLLRVLRRSQAL